MGKKILKVLLTLFVIFILLLCAKQTFNFLYNESLISDYERGDYSVDNILEFANIFEPYIVYYNNGNVAYRQMDYESAMNYYQQAIDHDEDHEAQCKTRINFALTHIATLPDDYDEIENIPASLETLYAALEVLTEEDCDEHNRQAEKLREDIEDEIERLEELLQQQQQQQQEQDEMTEEEQQQQQEEQEQQEQEQQEREENLEEQLEQQMQDAMDERQEELQAGEEEDVGGYGSPTGAFW